MAEQNIRITRAVGLNENAIIFETNSHDMYTSPPGLLVDEKIECLLDPVHSDSGSDNSASSRPGAIDYYPKTYDNKKKPTDTIQRCADNNDAAYDDAFEVESDMSSLESPRDPNAVTDSAVVNPPMDRDVVIDMPEAEVDATVSINSLTGAKYQGDCGYDEAVPAFSDDDDVVITNRNTNREPRREPPRNQHQYQRQQPVNLHRTLYSNVGNERPDWAPVWGNTAEWSRSGDPRQRQSEDARRRNMDIERELSRQTGRTAPLANVDDEFRNEYELQDMCKHRMPSTEPFKTREHVENKLASLFSEDSKSSEESSKQQDNAKKKKTKKRRNKSTSGADGDEMDENGNPAAEPTKPEPRSAPKKLQRYASAEITPSPDPIRYQNSAFRDTIHPSTFPRLTAVPNSNPLQYTDRASLDSNKTSDSRADRKKKKPKTEKNVQVIKPEDEPGYQGNKDIDDIMQFIDGGDPKTLKKKNNLKLVEKDKKDNKKVKSKTPEPRAEHETDSTGSETVSIPDQANSGRRTEARTKPDPEVEEVVWVKPEEFKLVGGKKKRRSGKDSKFEVERPIRSKTPPPRTEFKVASSSSAGKSEDRSLSPSAFPLLNGDVPSSGRRNSTGNAPSEIQEHSDVSAGEARTGAVMSYAKIAASPRQPPAFFTRLATESDQTASNDESGRDDHVTHDHVANSSHVTHENVTRDNVKNVNHVAQDHVTKNAANHVAHDHVTKNANHATYDHVVKNSNHVTRDHVVKNTSHATHVKNNESPVKEVEAVEPPPVSSSDEFPSLPRLARSEPAPGASPDSAGPAPALPAPPGLPGPAAPPGPPGLPAPPVPETSELCASSALAEAAEALGAASKQAVIFLDDDTSPQDLGISFIYDESLACKPSPELVAAVEQGHFEPAPSFSAADISFISVDSKAEAYQSVMHMNGMVQPKAKVRNDVKVKAEPVRSPVDDELRRSISDAVKFIRKTWIRIQEQKANGTMRVIEYSAGD